MSATRELSTQSWLHEAAGADQHGPGTPKEASKQLPEAAPRRETTADRLAMTLGLDGGEISNLDDLDSALDSAQSIRRMLLEVALNTHRDPEEALNVAMKMAEFVLQGDPVETNLTAGAQPAPAAAPRPRITERLGMTQSHVRWTPEQDEDVRQLWNQGLPVVEIASRLGRTPASINSRVRTLRLSKRRTWRADGEEAQRTGTNG